MIKAEMPSDEELRLKDLFSYEILDTLPEADFDDLVELAGLICKCPISLISLLDKERQWFKSKKGLTTTETSRDIAFCSHAILENDIMVVNDAALDVRFKDNPLVTGDLKIRFYAGAPIISPEGYKLGTICVIDHEPKQLTPEEERALLLLSRQVSKLVLIRKKNILIREVEEIVTLKKKAVSGVIKDYRASKNAVATNLHENIAQVIAAAILYVKEAEKMDSVKSPLLKIALEEMQAALEKIKQLSYSLTRLTASWLLIEDLVNQFLVNISDSFPFEIRFKLVGHKSSKPLDKTAMVIQIIEKWLKKLSEKNDITLVLILLNSDNKFELMMEDNSPSSDLWVLNNDISESLLSEMAGIGESHLEVLIPEPGRNVIKITWPD